MDTVKRKEHWENVFQTKDTSGVSWYQRVPETSLKLIEELKLPKSSPIIEIGSGDSFLGDHLLAQGYSAISLLDISDRAFEIVKARLVDDAKKITFISADVINFKSKLKYKLWHDRAVFHFLTDKDDISKYLQNATDYIESGGYMIIGTFSKDGPNLCSDLEVQQYSEKEITDRFKKDFALIKCFYENHVTPSGSKQNFLFCIFKRK